MMKIKILFILLLFFLTGVFFQIKSQVTIGSSVPPAKAALLQIKDRDPVDPANNNVTSVSGGLVLSRVNLVNINSLEPFVDTTAADYATQKLLHIGMIVYNLTNSGNALVPGLYEWDGKRWSIMTSQQTSEFGIQDCSKISVFGNYFSNVALGASNYITVPLRVTTPGSYSLLARTGNGYYFQASGVFDAAGDYVIRLEGMGTPSAVGTDVLSITNNGVDIKDTGNNICTSTISVQPTVVSYAITCDGSTVNGIYTTGQALNTSNTVTIPVTVTHAGTIAFATNTNNGMFFSVNQSVDASTTTLTLTGSGIPTRAGLYAFNFTTNGANPVVCTFNVRVETNLGSFDTPAKSCFAILSEDPTKPNGEYWIQSTQGSTTAVKTACDMTNGGYTLIWSYSEATSYNTYAPAGMQQDNLSMVTSLPYNVVSTEGGTINYNNYRLAKATMSNVKNAAIGQYWVRISYSPTDVNDAWAQNNFFKAVPSVATMDFIDGTAGGSTCYESQVPTTGKIFGLVYNGTTNTPTYNGVNVAGDICPYYTGAGYGTHWDAGFRMASAATAYTVDFPRYDNTTISLTFNPGRFNNLFGWHGVGEGEINHHWGKCGSAAADDYAFTTMNCNSQYPHSFNGGQGRYLQWWVK